MLYYWTILKFGVCAIRLKEHDHKIYLMFIQSDHHTNRTKDYKDTTQKICCQQSYKNLTVDMNDSNYLIIF